MAESHLLLPDLMVSPRATLPLGVLMNAVGCKRLKVTGVTILTNRRTDGQTDRNEPLVLFLQTNTPP